MSSRTTTSFVTFLFPSMGAGYADDLPAGENDVLAGDDVVLTHIFAAYPRTATSQLINRNTGTSELRAVDRQDQTLALAQDQVNATTSVAKNSAAALSPSEDRK